MISNTQQKVTDQYRNNPFWENTEACENIVAVPECDLPLNYRLRNYANLLIARGSLDFAAAMIEAACFIEERK